MERGREIDGDDHIPIFARKFLDRRGTLNPDVVDERIKTQSVLPSAETAAMLSLLAAPASEILRNSLAVISAA